jgi:NAD(P)-dependent dehydrogenase (short-subunit alcohol dehydrogenase family)
VSSGQLEFGANRADPRRGDADPERRRATIAQIPLGRMGQPEDIADAILDLASDEWQRVTGSPVTVDGGYLVQ